MCETLVEDLIRHLLKSPCDSMVAMLTWELYAERDIVRVLNISRALPQKLSREKDKVRAHALQKRQNEHHLCIDIITF